MPTATDHPDNLNRALVSARMAIGATVSKDGYNKDQKYRFVGHEQVLVSGARAVLLAHGLVLEQRSVTYAGELIAETRSGKRSVWRWTGGYALVHVSGEERSYSYEATTQPNDKAAFVASTALDRVAHMRVLALASSDEENPEADVHDQDGVVQQRQQAPQRGQPAPQRGPSNVVNFRAAQKPVEQPSQWSAGLEMYRMQMREHRTAEALMAWWVRFVTTLPPGLDKGLTVEMWEMFCAYGDSLNLPMTELARDIDARVKAAKAAKKGGV